MCVMTFMCFLLCQLDDGFDELLLQRRCGGMDVQLLTSRQDWNDECSNMCDNIHDDDNGRTCGNGSEIGKKIWEKRSTRAKTSKR